MICLILPYLGHKDYVRFLNRRISNFIIIGGTKWLKS